MPGVPGGRIGTPEAQPGEPLGGQASARPWLADFETHDYRSVWAGKRAEDAAQKHIIGSWLTPGDTCLELGAGFGRITRILEPKFTKVLALEYATRNIAAARNAVRKADLARADVARIPARDSVFDCVVMIRVAHLLEDPEAVMKEASRVAKDGATVIISIPNLAMNNLLWFLKRLALPEGLRNRATVFGPAAWPFDERPYFIRPEFFVPGTFKLVSRRGTGILDNAAGRAFSGSKHIYLLDVATSRLWPFKLDVFMKFKVAKESGRGD